MKKKIHPINFKIRDLISAIHPIDALEQEQIAFALQWIESGAEIFRTEQPATPATHVVSYFLVVSPEHSQVLLVDHKKAGLWLPSGGHVEPGEHPTETVLREAKEELGIDAAFLFDSPIFLTIATAAGSVTPHTDVLLWYVLKGNPQDPLVYDEGEFHQIRWFRMDEVPFEKSDPHLKRFIRKMQNKASKGVSCHHNDSQLFCKASSNGICNCRKNSLAKKRYQVKIVEKQ